MRNARPSRAQARPSAAAATTGSRVLDSRASRSSTRGLAPGPAAAPSTRRPHRARPQRTTTTVPAQGATSAGRRRGRCRPRVRGGLQPGPRPATGRPRSRAQRCFGWSRPCRRAVPAVRQNAAALVSAGEIPSLGSVGHHARQCKPCAFVATSGCSNGGTCEFCHLCEPGEKKRRQKEKRTMRSAMRDLRNMRRQAAATSQGVGLVMSSSGQAPVRAGARAAEPLRALASLA